MDQVTENQSEYASTIKGFKLTVYDNDLNVVGSVEDEFELDEGETRIAQVNIEHFGTDNNGNALNGIVRNHVYDLSLNSQKGLGVPVFDPDREIIPDTPQDEDGYYIAARINILKWKVVSQDVNFE